MKTGAKYGSLVLSILFAMWFANDPSFEPFIGLLASRGAFIWPDFQEYWRARSSKGYEHDKEVYKVIVNAFEKNDLVTFLREANFSAPFATRYGSSLISIEERLRPPKFEFWDKRLEGLRNDLFESLSDFTHRLSYDTYPLGDDRHTVIPDDYRGIAARIPEEIENTIQNLHTLAGKVLQKFSLLYKEGGKRFNLNI